MENYSSSYVHNQFHLENPTPPSQTPKPEELTILDKKDNAKNNFENNLKEITEKSQNKIVVIGILSQPVAENQSK